MVQREIFLLSKFLLLLFAFLRAREEIEKSSENGWWININIYLQIFLQDELRFNNQLIESNPEIISPPGKHSQPDPL